MLSPDIDENILAALQQIFITELQTNLVGDSLAMNVIKQADLQDDPTLLAPYLVYRPDIEKGIQPVPKDLECEYGNKEIGGPLRFLHYYECTFGVPRAVSRGDARTSLAIVETRISQVLMEYFDLSGILRIGSITSPDQSKILEGANPYLIDKMTSHIFGGETEFYGKGQIYWHYPVSWYIQSRINLNG